MSIYSYITNWSTVSKVLKTISYLHQFLKMINIKVGKKGDLKMDHHN